MQIPSSGVVVGKSRIKSTPGFGEALLRGQVKNLLQKVEEEEAHLIKKISVESRPFIHLATSPMGLLAPTPANTPTSYRWSTDCDHISRCFRTDQSSSSIISGKPRFFVCIDFNSIEMIVIKRLSRRCFSFWHSRWRRGKCLWRKTIAWTRVF